MNDATESEPGFVKSLWVVCMHMAAFGVQSAAIYNKSRQLPGGIGTQTYGPSSLKKDASSSLHPPFEQSCPRQEADEGLL